MRFGILHTSLAGASLSGAFERASQAGAEGVEIMYQEPAEADLLARPEHLGQTKALAERHGLAVPSLCLGCLCRRPSLIGEAKLITQSQELICRALSAAAGIGSRVVLVPFFGKNSIETEHELNRAAEALLELVDHAEDNDVVMGIESNLNFAQQDFLLGFLGHVPHVKIYYDTGNPLPRKLDVPGGIRLLGRDKIVQVHVKDVRVVEGAPPDYGVPLGGGNVDLRACAEALKAIGYDGWLILETPPGDDPIASARANLDHIRALLAG